MCEMLSRIRMETSRSLRTVCRRAWVRSFSYNDPSSTSFHSALTRYEMAPGARPCFRKKRRSDRSRVVLYRCSLFLVTATGAVFELSAASGARASGRMEEEAATALWVSAMVLRFNLKCQGYYWPQPQFWQVAVQMMKPISDSVPSSPGLGDQETSLGSGVPTSPVAVLSPAARKKVAVSLLVASLPLCAAWPSSCIICVCHISWSSPGK